MAILVAESRSGELVDALYPPWKTRAPTTTLSTYPLDAASVSTKGVSGITGNSVNVAIPVKAEVVATEKEVPAARVVVEAKVPGAMTVADKLAVMVSVPDAVSSTSFVVEVKLTTSVLPPLPVRVITADAPPEAGSVYVVSVGALPPVIDVMCPVLLVITSVG
tara:strand:- start:113 stop:601 length:489 start_codon:yes stop_codon:yes gene_type:complete